MLFRWDSEFLRRYGSGDIIVVAEGVEHARMKAREFFNEYCPAPWSEEFWEIEEHKRKKEYFENDIKVQPQEVVCGVIFIPGSD